MTPIGDRVRTAAEILDDFARRTGLAPGDGAADAPPDRYLWTDAHAVCTWLGLHGETGEERHLDLALALVDQVHRVLGRHRDDDPREGWLSGTGEEEGARHPTAGGLRIGKPRPERPPGEPVDPDAEWDRDGQYFHYLTRWMHALHRVSQHTGETRYHRWAVELAAAAYDGFVLDGRMVWKTSVDLSRPTVPSMGHHDPLDGLVTYSVLQARDVDSDAGRSIPDLSRDIRGFEAMCEGRSWATADPLGAGGLLLDLWRWARLVARAQVPDEGRLKWLAREAGRSVDEVARRTSPEAPPERRLAFRELGLSLGLHAVERLAGLVADDPELARDDALAHRVESLLAHVPLATTLEASWLRPGSREAHTWTGHRNINAVSLATSLAPSGYLGG